MPVAKKRVGRPSHIAAAPTGVNTFFLQDPASGTRFLVDTGAARSLLPVARCKGPYQPATSIRLTAANGTPIPVYGQQHMKINIAGRN